MPLLLGVLSGIAGWFSSLGAAIVAFFGIKTLEWSATKVFWFFCITVVLPIVLYNVIVMFVCSFIEFGSSLISEQAGDLNQSLAMQFTGMGGWVAQQIYLPQAFSTYMSAVAARMIIRFIPFMT
jgi:hypothetical protein